MNITGLVLIIGSSLIPIPWFIGEPEVAREPLAVFSQYIGSVAIILMAWSQLLATRLRGIEAVFGSQDRNYVLHKWLGIIAMLAVLVHDTIDAELNGARETFWVDLGETLGEISLYGLLILVTITLITFVPYRFWRQTHRFVGAFFALSALHYVLVPTPFELLDPAGLYVLSFCVLGVLAYAYTLVPFANRLGQKTYRLAASFETGGAVAINLVAEGRGLAHRPGQFAFMRFEGRDRREIHPFTISSAPAQDRSLRFTIRPLGDFTDQLQSFLTPDAQVSIDGPYGHFYLKQTKGPQVWIAAGVGITPFVAWAAALDPGTPPVHLYFCVKDTSQAPHLDELKTLAADKPNLSLHMVVSGQDGRLTVDRLAADLGDQFQAADFAFCGPIEMRKALQTDVHSRGIPPSRFRYEEFEIRSGVDVIKWAKWLIRKVQGGSR